jgi:isoleucyl-tRNA synthetase
VADELHRNLAGSVPERQSRTAESVHLADWPAADPAARDVALEAEMARARAVVSLGLAARMEAKLKVRRPLRQAFVLLPDRGVLSPELAAEVADALNVKQLQAITDLEGLLDYSVVPNFRTLGPRVGKAMPLVKDALAGVDGVAVRQAFDADGGFDLVLGDGTTVRLGPDDVDVRAASHEELALAQEGGYAVALDTTTDDELLAEGMARDVVRLINEERKARGFEIADRIRVRIAVGGRLQAAVHAHRDRIAADVLAVSFELVGELPGATELEVDGEPLTLAIEQV